MVSKCANPACPASFRYLHQGKLFRIEVETSESESLSPEIRRVHSRVEFYWLCDDCAGSMTLAYKKGSGVTAVPARRPPLPSETAAIVRSAAIGS